MSGAARKVRILNMDIDTVTMDELLEKREGTILTLHVDMIAKLQKDRDFYDSVNQFDVITCDSQILYWAAGFLGEDLPERVSGSDFFPLFYTKYADDPSVTIFLCGAMDDIAERAATEINAKVGREMVVGAYGPAPKWRDNPDEIERMIEKVNQSGATVLVVGLAAGVQEWFIATQRHRMPGVKLFLPLGGTIDYEAGTVKRPPPYVTKAGLEWLWRLVREPSRRWRRYLIHQPPVLWLLAKQRLGRYDDPFA